jgi:hypothetical protein
MVETAESQAPSIAARIAEELERRRLERLKMSGEQLVSVMGSGRRLSGRRPSSRTCCGEARACLKRGVARWKNEWHEHADC